MSIENMIKSVGKGAPVEDLNTEGIATDALNDLVKDEILGLLEKSI